MSIRTGIAALAMAGILAGCARNEETGRATVDAVTDNPNDYIGQTITVRGEVSELQNDGKVFTVEDHDWIFPEELLIITPRQVSEMAPQAGEQLSEDIQVRVTGTVRQLVVADIEREYGLDLDSQIEVEYRDRPILIATALEVNPGEAQTGQEFRTDETGMAEDTAGQPGTPTPGDSALLERDLPAGDTLNQQENQPGMQTGEMREYQDTTYPGAANPPPADSALLERDLPHTPAGDTTGGTTTDTLPAGESRY